MKKRADDKRAALPRRCDFTNAFLKDWERLTRSGRFDMPRLKQAMLHLVANDVPLGPEWLDHPLKGGWDGHRECHVHGDFLLVYKIADHGKAQTIIFVAAGTHADLFGG